MNTRTDEDVHVLVVDDVEQNLLAMEALLSRPGLRVLKAASGAQALELLLQHEVALALLDVQMPELDGFALAELMRGAERTKGVPIIFMTAEPHDASRPFHGYEAGAVDFLSKPIDPRVIVSKVNVFVELFEQRRQLRERNAELQQWVKLNETMAAVLTHDLRTPLAAITMSAELVKATARDDTTRKSALRIKASAQRMGRMIEQLLDFSRIRSGVLRLQTGSANLHTVCSAVVAEIAQARPSARIELQAEGDLNGRFDTDRLMQVMSNLIGNAIQHGEPDMPVQVRLDGSRHGWLRAEVRNAGSVPPEVLPQLFKPFHSGEGRDASGLGLGLYIVEQFVRAHGGTVQAASAGGVTCFVLEIPRTVAGEAAAQPEPVSLP
jgi:signal transduction histidine kinase